MKRVLVVDDALFMRVRLKDILERNGFEVVGEGSNGIEAVERYKELNPDVVTLDITMPEMDGIEALQGIMNYDPKAKVIMCSAMGQQFMVLDAMKYGAKNFIVKPFQEEKIIETLSDL